MTKQQIQEKLNEENLIWFEQKSEKITYFNAFKQQNIKGVLFWIWIILILIGIGAANYLKTTDFIIFTLFMLLGAYHFHEKTNKLLQEASIIYGFTNKIIFKINNNSFQKYPISELLDINITELDNNKRDISFVFQPQNEDFTKNDIKGIVSFKKVALTDKLIEQLKENIID